MAIDTSAGASSSRFGHADMYSAQLAGTDPREILQFLTANPNKLSQDNKPGAGGVYDLIAQQAINSQAAEEAAAERAAEIKRQEQMQAAAEAAQAERLRQMEIGARTQAANISRAGLESKFQIKSRSNAAGTGGTQGFKRRQLQVNPSVYSSVSAGKPTLPGVLNV